MVLNHLKNLNYKLQLEKLVIGVEEPVFIKGVGTMMAKSDSGNGAFNVIHGEDFYYQGETVVFTTFDDDGNPHKVSKKIQDKVTINIGGGHTEDRPVVLFDVKFANDEFMNVPFTVGNRASNKNKVLLGKNFLVKELDAIIDVGSQNLADKNIEIEIPINEDAQQKNPKDAWGIGKQQGYASSAARVAGKSLAIAWNTFKQLGSTEPIWKIADNVLSPFKWYNDIKSYFSLDFLDGWMRQTEKSDKEVIVKAVMEELQAKGIPYQSLLVNPKVIKMLDFTGMTYTGKNKVPEKLGETITGQLENVPAENKNQESETTNTTSEQDDSRFMPPADREVQTKNESVSIEDNNVLNEELANPLQSNQQLDTSIVKWKKGEREAANIAKNIKKLANSSKPILYMLVYNAKNVERVKQVLIERANVGSNIYNNLENIIDKMISTGVINPVELNSFCNDVSMLLRNENIFVTFALVQGEPGSRKATFITPIVQEETGESADFLNQKIEFDKLISPEVYEQYKADGTFSEKFPRNSTYANNKEFGFNQYARKNADKLANLSKSEQIKNWAKEYTDSHQIDIMNALNVYNGGENKYKNAYSALAKIPKHINDRYKTLISFFNKNDREQASNLATKYEAITNNPKLRNKDRIDEYDKLLKQYEETEKNIKPVKTSNKKYRIDLPNSYKEKSNRIKKAIGGTDESIKFSQELEAIEDRFKNGEIDENEFTQQYKNAIDEKYNDINNRPQLKISRNDISDIDELYEFLKKAGENRKANDLKDEFETLKNNLKNIKSEEDLKDKLEALKNKYSNDSDESSSQEETNNQTEEISEPSEETPSEDKQEEPESELENSNDQSTEESSNQEDQTEPEEKPKDATDKFIEDQTNHFKNITAKFSDDEYASVSGFDKSESESKNTGKSDTIDIDLRDIEKKNKSPEEIQKHKESLTKLANKNTIKPESIKKYNQKLDNHQELNKGEILGLAGLFYNTRNNHTLPKKANAYVMPKADKDRFWPIVKEKLPTYIKQLIRGGYDEEADKFSTYLAYMIDKKRPQNKPPKS